MSGETDASAAPSQPTTTGVAISNSASARGAPEPAESSTSAPSASPIAEPEAPNSEFCNPEKPEVPSPDNRIYATWQSIRVPLGSGLGIGALRVLEDSRITRRGSRPYDETHPVLPPCALLDSRLELLDAAGKPVQTEKLWPQVDIVVHQMGPNATIYEAIEDIRCIASCWCGDGHSFWRVENGKLITHTARLVEKSPAWTKPTLGTLVPAEHVTHGCYSSSHFERNERGVLVLKIHRAAMGSGSADERYWFDDGEWKASHFQ